MIVPVGRRERNYYEIVFDSDRHATSRTEAFEGREREREGAVRMGGYLSVYYMVVCDRNNMCARERGKVPIFISIRVTVTNLHSIVFLHASPPPRHIDSGFGLPGVKTVLCAHSSLFALRCMAVGMSVTLLHRLFVFIFVSHCFDFAMPILDGRRLKKVRLNSRIVVMVIWYAHLWRYRRI